MISECVEKKQRYIITKHKPSYNCAVELVASQTSVEFAPAKNIGGRPSKKSAQLLWRSQDKIRKSRENTCNMMWWRYSHGSVKEACLTVPVGGSYRDSNYLGFDSDHHG